LIDAAAHDRDGRAFGDQRAFVRSGINAER
jgi:hypothetical protein